MTPALERYASEPYCYLTTTGRVSGNPHEIEIWFGLNDGVLYLLSGGRERSDWVKNIQADPAVRLRIRDQEFEATARVVTDEEEDALARRLLAAKYQNWHEGQEMTDWARTALPVALEIQ